MQAIKILNEIIEISGKLEGKYDHDSGEELKRYISMLNGFLARLPKLEAEAEELLYRKRGEVTHREASKNKKEQLSATLFKEVLDAETANEQKIYKYAYRLNKNLLEILKGVITQLSYEKAQAPTRSEADLVENMKKLNKEVLNLKSQVQEMQVEGL